MLEKNIRLNLWINPYVSQKRSFYKAIAPYTGSHTVWNGASARLYDAGGKKNYSLANWKKTR